MRKITEAQVELIDAVVAESAAGGLTAAIIEKDIHVTEVLHTLFALKFEHLSLVFCGGTSLSKAHGIIERMSEDVDVKVVLSDSHGMSRTATKKYLKNFKDNVVAMMEGLGFIQDPAGYKILNEYHYVATTWLYDSAYATDESLRPHLSLEFTVRTPKFPPAPVPIGYLVSKLAGQTNKEVTISCIAVEETLAEKALSFLRRHAQHRSGNMTQAWDTALVRHIYDTYCIVHSDGRAVEKAKRHFGDLVAFDVTEFTQHEAFTSDPKMCLSETLALAETELQTIEEYRTRLIPLIYGNVKPSFSDAFAVFKTSSEALLATL